MEFLKEQENLAAERAGVIKSCTNVTAGLDGSVMEDWI